MSAISIELPDQVHERATKLARERGLSLDRLMLVALIEKLSTATSLTLEERAARGTPNGFDEFLAGVPDVPPELPDLPPKR